MNDLEKYFLENKRRGIHKLDHYFEIYDRHFSRYRGTDVCVIEFGVSEGGSLQMWKNYFGPKARIFGVDVNPLCKQYEEEQIKIIIGDQENRPFLRSIAKAVPRIDIVIEDGGHTMKQQINTYEELFPLVEENGIYLCEDICTSYWREFGGGYKKSGTFIEYGKNFIDYLHAWHSKQDELPVTEFTRTVYSLHFYDSILVIEKRPRLKPSHVTSGTSSMNASKLRIRALSRWVKLKTFLRGKFGF